MSIWKGKGATVGCEKMKVIENISHYYL
jgi:hypothetical protein